MAKYKEASREIARLSEIIMLEQDVDFITAQAIVLRKDPELFKLYIEEINCMTSSFRKETGDVHRKK